MRLLLFTLCLSLVGFLSSCSKPSKSLRDESGRLEILFLGHDSEHHNSAIYLPLLASQLSLEGINFTYTSNPNDLNSATLNNYDALVVYANHDSITADQERALLDFVEN